MIFQLPNFTTIAAYQQEYPPKIGKSSLVVEVLRRQKVLPGIYVDLMEVKSEENLFQRFARGVLSAKYKKSMFLLKSLNII